MHTNPGMRMRIASNEGRKKRESNETVPDTSSNIANETPVSIQKCLPPKGCETDFLPICTFKFEDGIITRFILEGGQFCFIQF